MMSFIYTVLKETDPLSDFIFSDPVTYGRPSGLDAFFLTAEPIQGL